MEIQIWSGEGDGPGTCETYRGKRTLRALRTRLTREEAGGDRWASAEWETGEPVYLGPTATDADLVRQTSRRSSASARSNQ